MSFFRSVFLCVVFGIARRAVFGRAFFLVPVLVNGEYPRRVAYGILGHGFVRDKPYALNDSVRAFDVYGTIGVDALFLLVPVNLFGEEAFVLHVLDANVAPEPPQLQLVVEDGGVRAYDLCYSQGGIHAYFSGVRPVFRLQRKEKFGENKKEKVDSDVQKNMDKAQELEEICKNLKKNLEDVKQMKENLEKSIDYLDNILKDSYNN